MAEEAAEDDLSFEEPMVGLDDDLGGDENKSLLSTLMTPDVLRQVILILGLVIMIAVSIFILIWGNKPEMRPLGIYNNEELIEVLNILDQEKIEYSIDGNTVLVIAEEFQDIRLRMMRAGLINTDDSDGLSLLEDPSFGMSQRMEAELLKVSQERKISSAIEAMKSVRKARVLLAMPKENVFARDKRKPSATIVLILNQPILKQQEIDAIVDTVTTAVHGLEPNRVTVTDQGGRLLNSGSQDPLAAKTRKEFEMQKRKEEEYRKKIDAILSPVIGLENYTAEVDVSIDFAQLEQTRKTYNPDLPSVRSEMTLEEKSVGSNPLGIPGALSNQPPLESNIPEEVDEDNPRPPPPVPGRSRKEETRNFELDTTISHKRQSLGGIKRLTVSVAVDYKMQTDDNGERTYLERTEEELDTVRRLIRGGLGIDVNRGDTLEVVTIRFDKPEAPEIVIPPFYEQEWFAELTKMVAAVFMVLLVLLIVVRPLLNKVMHKEEEQMEDFDLDSSALGGSDDLSLFSEADMEGEFVMKDGQINLPDLNKDEDLMKAIRALVANEPDLSALVVRTWIEDN